MISIVTQSIVTQSISEETRRRAASRTVVILWLTLAWAFVRPCWADELRFDAEALWSRSVSLGLQRSADGHSIELAPGALFEDDGPAAGYSFQPNVEKLTPDVWIKKELLIRDPRATKATLLVGRGGDLKAIVNGKAMVLDREGKVDNYWEAYAFSPAALRPGKNEVVLHGSGRVWIARDDEFAAGSRTRTKHPNRSAKSTDGGKSWDYDRLGAANDVDGEYYVRLVLDQYRAAGSLTLPVVDSGNLDDQPLSPPIDTLGSIRVTVDGEAGAGGTITVRARSGPSPVPGAKSWSNWHDLGTGGGTLKAPRGRYLQIELALATTNPLQTPKLQQVTVVATPKRAADWVRRVRVVESHNERVVRSSIPFEYEPLDHPGLKALRRRHKLDDVVNGAQSEFELITRLAVWSSKQWQRGHITTNYPAWDALQILEPHQDGTPVGGFCQQYNLVFLQACESFGLIGRAVSIGPGAWAKKIRGGHEVVEIWSNEHKKWIYVDGNTAWYAVDEATGVPRSLWELRQRQLAVLAGRAARPIRVVNIVETKHAWRGLHAWPPFVELRLIPRTNFLEAKSPLPLNQGMRGWFWTGHYAWTDAEHPASLLYGNRVAARSNWEWTLNQAAYTLEATDTAGEVRVHLDTQTPGFDTFVAEIDDSGIRPVRSGFVWKLRSGVNRLRVRPRNIAAGQGIASWVVLDYQAPK